MRSARLTMLLAACFMVAGGVADRLAAQVETLTANKGVKKLKVQTNPSPASTSSTTFSTLASTSLSIPTGQTGRFVIRFVGESTCNGGTAGNTCQLLIQVDSSCLIMNPNDLGGVGCARIFDTDDSGDNFPEAHAMETVSDVLGPGSHTIDVLWRVQSFGGGNPTFTLDDSVLTVELWRVS